MQKSSGLGSHGSSFLSLWGALPAETSSRQARTGTEAWKTVKPVVAVDSTVKCRVVLNVGQAWKDGHQGIQQLWVPPGLGMPQRSGSKSCLKSLQHSYPLALSCLLEHNLSPGGVTKDLQVPQALSIYIAVFAGSSFKELFIPPFMNNAFHGGMNPGPWCMCLPPSGEPVTVAAWGECLCRCLLRS